MDNNETMKARLEIADILDAFAREPTWNPQLWERFDQLLKKTPMDSLLSGADETLIHYSGCFNETNILGFRAKADPKELNQLRDRLMAIARDLRGVTALDVESESDA